VEHCCKAVILDWDNFTVTKQFPVVIASDCVYTDQHGRALANCAFHFIDPNESSEYFYSPLFWR
jgi:hypothetical protein